MPVAMPAVLRNLRLFERRWKPASRALEGLSSAEGGKDRSRSGLLRATPQFRAAAFSGIVRDSDSWSWADESSAARSRLGPSEGHTARSSTFRYGSRPANEEGPSEGGRRSPFGDESFRHRTRTGPARHLLILFDSALPDCARSFHCRCQP